MKDKTFAETDFSVQITQPTTAEPTETCFSPYPERYRFQEVQAYYEQQHITCAS